MGTDFFDDDLVREREAALKIKLDGTDKAPRDGFIPPSREIPARPVGDLPLTQLVRQKQGVQDQMADKAQELDRLRARQDELERERRLLEEMRQKQDAFETGRRELKAILAESIVRMDKERQQANRLLHVLDETQRLLRDHSEEVSALDSESWDDENLLEELNKALAVLEHAREDYNQSMAKIEAVHAGAPSRLAPVPTASDWSSGPSGFAYWLRAGLAFMLPFMVLVTLLALLWMILYFFA